MVKLYSTHCAKCNVVETKLKQKNIPYEESNDVDYMNEHQIEPATLEVDGKLLPFAEAVKWINIQ